MELGTSEVRGMTEAELLEIIAGGESFTVEFKGEGRQPLSDRDLVEAVVCLANGEGGLLLVGVEDDGTVTGARPRHEGGFTDPRRVQALIANQTRPSLATRVYSVEVRGKMVLAIDVPRSPVPVGTTEGKYLRRAIGGRGEPACVPYHFHEMQAGWQMEAPRTTRR
ncbi:MAG: ATP-binding protein [Bacillota bacterium]